MFDDLRGFLEEVDRIGQLKQVDGADWNLEIGALTELVSEQESYALVFDKIKGYPEGYRVATNILQSHVRQKVSLGFGQELTDLEIVKQWKDKSTKYKPVPPVEVKSGPILENILTGDKVNILNFPVPKWHEQDGGRYIGTGCLVITKDPDENWVNLGVYRVMVHDKDTLGFYVSPAKHATIMREKYWARGEDCPVVMCFGQELILWTIAGMPLPWGVPELDFAGHMRGKPVEIIKGDITGLPIPSTAEIAIEGFSKPPSVDGRGEGPFGEWPGYYASGSRIEPVVKIEAIYHRNNPIIHGQPPIKGESAYPIPLRTAGSLWDALEKAGVQGIKGVWVYGPSHRIIPVISIKQIHLGHAKQVATLAAALFQGGACLGRWTIVVDDDVDPSNWEEVVWALTTRCDPEESIDIVRGYLTSPLDPMLSPEKRARGDFTTAKVIINACKPWHWIDKFPPTNVFSEDIRRKAMSKWKELFI